MKNASITLRLNETDKARLEQIAYKKDVSVAQIIREAIKDRLSKESQT